ncbi:hypothetical protein MPER_06748 [Moniliophthora perniciosa FA553]|nr:hypothetical protein MPER_06748 [Moniliophthora perniciosa FA553]
MASSLEYCLSIKKQGKIVEAPLLMASQTCFLWRVIITRRREWWSSASVDISRLQWDIVPLLDTFFDYSAGHPLTIKVIDSKKDDMRDFWEDPSDFGYEGEDAWDVYYDRHLAPCGFKAFSSLVWGQSAQIENLEISTDEYILKYEDLASRSWSFPLLRSFTFNDTFSEFNDSFYNSVFEAPLLSHVELVEPLSELSEIEHLTHLRFSCLTRVWGPKRPSIMRQVSNSLTIGLVRMAIGPQDSQRWPAEREFGLYQFPGSFPLGPF